MFRPGNENRREREEGVEEQGGRNVRQRIENPQNQQINLQPVPPFAQASTRHQRTVERSLSILNFLRPGDTEPREYDNNFDRFVDYTYLSIHQNIRDSNNFLARVNNEATAGETPLPREQLHTIREVTAYKALLLVSNISLLSRDEQLLPSDQRGEIVYNRVNRTASLIRQMRNEGTYNRWQNREDERRQQGGEEQERGGRN